MQIDINENRAITKLTALELAAFERCWRKRKRSVAELSVGFGISVSQCHRLQAAIRAGRSYVRELQDHVTERGVRKAIR